jgi:hypothetical protein
VEHLLSVKARALTTGLALACLLATGVAHAQPAPVPPEEARRLFSEATEAMQKSEFAVACPKLERVIELVPDGIGAKLALGDCYKGIGRLASAQRAYVAAEAAAAAASAGDRQREARSKADALGPLLAKLTLELAPEVRALPDLGVSRDGVPISSAELGIPVAVDAGSHVIVVVAKDRLPFEAKVEIKDGEKRAVSVSELLLKPAEATPALGPVVAPPPTTPPPPRPPVPFWGPQRVAGLIVALAGVTGVGVGATFGVLTKLSVDESNDLGCDADTAVCPDQASYDERKKALTFAHVSTGTLIGGGVLLATGVIVFVTAPSENTEVALGPGSLTFTGRF